MTLEILLAFSIGILGIFTGTQIAEGALLVPYWKTLPGDVFFDLHKTYGKKIYRFFAPITIVATVLPVATVIYSLMTEIQTGIPMLLMGVFTLLFFSTYFIYFQKANKSFAEKSLTNEQLPQELDTWEKWHWGRIFCELIALICAIISQTAI
jgi:Domain of unknown function (DUF1772)